MEQAARALGLAVETARVRPVLDALAEARIERGDAAGAAADVRRGLEQQLRLPLWLEARYRKLPLTPKELGELFPREGPR